MSFSLEKSLSNPSMNDGFINHSQERINLRKQNTKASVPSLKKRHHGTSKRSQDIHITTSGVGEDDYDDFEVSDHMMNESVFL